MRIEEAFSVPAAVTVPQARVIQNPRLAWIVAAITTLVFASLAIVRFREKPAAASPEMRLEINTPSTPAPLNFALSPDGQHIVFAASGDGPQRLWLRSLDQTYAHPLPETETSEYPFSSKDSRSIGFFASGKLYRVDISGAQLQALAEASQGRGGTWNAEGTILFGPTATSGLFRVPSLGGGQPKRLTEADAAGAYLQPDRVV